MLSTKIHSPSPTVQKMNFTTQNRCHYCSKHRPSGPQRDPPPEGHHRQPRYFEITRNDPNRDSAEIKSLGLVCFRWYPEKTATTVIYARMRSFYSPIADAQSAQKLADCLGEWSLLFPWCAAVRSWSDLAPEWIGRGQAFKPAGAAAGP